MINKQRCKLKLRSSDGGKELFINTKNKSNPNVYIKGLKRTIAMP